MIETIIKCYFLANVVAFMYTVARICYWITTKDSRVIKRRQEFEDTKNDFYANGFGLVFWVLVSFVTVCMAAYHFLVWPKLLMPKRCKK